MSTPTISTAPHRRGLLLGLMLAASLLVLLGSSSLWAQRLTRNVIPNSPHTGMSGYGGSRWMHYDPYRYYLDRGYYYNLSAPYGYGLDYVIDFSDPQPRFYGPPTFGQPRAGMYASSYRGADPAAESSSTTYYSGYRGTDPLPDPRPTAYYSAYRGDDPSPEAQRSLVRREEVRRSTGWRGYYDVGGYRSSHMQFGYGSPAVGFGAPYRVGYRGAAYTDSNGYPTYDQHDFGLEPKITNMWRTQATTITGASAITPPYGVSTRIGRGVNGRPPRAVGFESPDHPLPQSP